MADPSPFAPAADGVRVAVRLTPKARQDRIQGTMSDAAGGRALKAAVTAAPEGGKANAALIRLLAREWGVARTRISVAAGATDRRKVLHVSGDPAALMPRLESWMKEAHG